MRHSGDMDAGEASLAKVAPIDSAHCVHWWDEEGPCCRCGYDGQEETDCPGKGVMTMNAKKEACARAAHEANRAYCLALGDTSQPAWEEAPEWQRTSALNGVDGVLSGNTPRESHESWLEEKTATGWKYGPVKDPEKKEHPCFVPYDELPPEQRQKDHVFVGVVTAMAKAFGLVQEAAA